MARTDVILLDISIKDPKPNLEIHYPNSKASQMGRITLIQKKLIDSKNYWKSITKGPAGSLTAGVWAKNVHLQQYIEKWDVRVLLKFCGHPWMQKSSHPWYLEIRKHELIY